MRVFVVLGLIFVAAYSFDVAMSDRSLFWPAMIVGCANLIASLFVSLG